MNLGLVWTCGGWLFSPSLLLAFKVKAVKCTNLSLSLTRNSTYFGHCWKKKISGGRARQLYDHIISQGSMGHVLPSARHIHCRGSCGRRSKFYFDHVLKNIFSLPQQTNWYTRWFIRVHQDQTETWSFLSQASGLEAGKRDSKLSLRASSSASVLQVGWCLWTCDCKSMWTWEKNSIPDLTWRQSTMCFRSTAYLKKGLTDF